MLKAFFSRYIAEEARPMLALATPIVLAELGWMTMGIVDTMMVGRQADSAVAIGAVSLGSILYYAVAIFGTGLMLGSIRWCPIPTAPAISKTPTARSLMEFISVWR